MNQNKNPADSGASLSDAGLGAWKPEGPYKSARTGAEYWVLGRPNKGWLGGIEYMTTPVDIVRKKFKSRDAAIKYAVTPNV